MKHPSTENSNQREDLIPFGIQQNIVEINKDMLIRQAYKAWFFRIGHLKYQGCGIFVNFYEWRSVSSDMKLFF